MAPHLPVWNEFVVHHTAALETLALMRSASANVQEIVEQTRELIEDIHKTIVCANALLQIAPAMIDVK